MKNLIMTLFCCSSCLLLSRISSCFIQYWNYFWVYVMLPILIMFGSSAWLKSWWFTVSWSKPEHLHLCVACSLLILRFFCQAPNLSLFWAYSGLILSCTQFALILGLFWAYSGLILSCTQFALILGLFWAYSKLIRSCTQFALILGLFWAGLF